MTESTSPKEFLTQAELKYGKNVARLIKLAMFGAGGALLWVVGPGILALLTLATAIVGQAIVLGGLLAFVFSLYMFFTNSRIRAMIRDQWAGLIESCIQAGIKVNPIARLNAYVDEYLQGKLNLVKKALDFIRARSNWHTDQIEKKSAELGNLITQAAHRKKRSFNEEAETWKNTAAAQEDREEFVLLSDQIVLLKQSLERLEKMGKRFELFMTLLEKQERAFDLSIRKTRSIVRTSSDEYEASQNMAAVTEAMSGVMNNTDERTRIFNATLEYVAQEIASNVAKVENDFDRTRSIIASADLQSEVAEEQLLAELSAMGDRTDAAISNLESKGATSVQDMVSRVRGADSVGVATQVASTMPSGSRKYEELIRKVRRN